MKYLVTINMTVDADSRQEAENTAIREFREGKYEDIVVVEQTAAYDRAEALRDAAIDSAIGDEGEEA